MTMTKQERIQARAVADVAIALNDGRHIHEGRVGASVVSVNVRAIGRMLNDALDETDHGPTVNHHHCAEDIRTLKAEVAGFRYALETAEEAEAIGIRVAAEKNRELEELRIIALGLWHRRDFGSGHPIVEELGQRLQKVCAR